MQTYFSSGGQPQRRYHPNTHPCWRNQWPRWARGSGMFAGLSDAPALWHNRSKDWQHCVYSRDWMQKKFQGWMQHTKKIHVYGPRWTSELGLLRPLPLRHIFWPFELIQLWLFLEDIIYMHIIITSTLVMACRLKSHFGARRIYWKNGTWWSEELWM